MEHSTTLTHLERFSPEDQARIQHALSFATKHHEPQKRISGAPYIIHPVAVAQSIIDEFHGDADTVIGGLLHDTVEDTPATLEDIEREFGPVIRFIVDGATNVGEGDGNQKIEDWHDRTDATTKKVKKYAAQDRRVYIVKFADRLNNLRTMNPSMRPKNQVRTSRYTLETHVPICREMGFVVQADEMECICKETIARWPEHIHY